MGDASSSASMAANNQAAQEVLSSSTVDARAAGVVRGSSGAFGGGGPSPYQQPYATSNQFSVDTNNTNSNNSAPPTNGPPITASSSTPSSARHNPYNMATMANALPQAAGYPPPPPHTYNAGPQHPNHHHFGNQQNLHALASQAGYYVPQQPQMNPYYNTQQHQSPQSMGMSSRPGGSYYANPMMMNQHHHQQQQGAVPPGYYYPQQQYGNMGLPHHGQINHGQYMMAGMSGVGSNRRNSVPNPAGHHESTNENTGSGSRDQRTNIVRGPPRKPRQSGHAIWIGNLPPQTDLMALVHHICRETVGLESLFLISKSNCAFANFKDDQSCVDAQQKLHDSKFQSVRLVSRLRKSTVEGAAGQTAPTGPAVTSPKPNSTNPQSDEDQEEIAPESEPPSVKGEAEKSTPAAAPAAASPVEVRSAPKSSATTEPVIQKDKFFILKSLTLEDLELSVRNGVWATQSHNEEILSKAYDSAENVYLVFSANKSGEYFGYAKMISPINRDPAAAIQFAPKIQTASEEDVPKAVPTEATEECPRGRIIDDSARGTIFWEVEREEGDGPEEADDSTTESVSSIKSGQEQESEEETQQAWGKPFQLRWLSTNRLPFYRTRGLRNPWNSNREVKIARDGTELEPAVGKRLIGLFNKPVQSPAPPSMMGRQGIMPPMAGFPPSQPMGMYRP